MQFCTEFKWWMIPVAMLLLCAIIALLIGFSPQDILPHTYNVY